MDNLNILTTSVVKYLHNDATYKYFLGNRNEQIPIELQNYIYGKSYVQQNIITFDYDTIYVLVDIIESKYDTIPIIIELSWTAEINKWTFLWGQLELIYVNNYVMTYGSEYIPKYPSIFTNLGLWRYPSILSNENIIEFLDSVKIINSNYRHNKFCKIKTKCIESIIFLKHALNKDISLQIIKIFVKIIPHWDDFIWCKKNEK
jgi:hypothetical protein